MLNTYSDHLRLTKEKRQRLFDAIEGVFEDNGSAIQKRYEVVLFVGRKQEGALATIAPGK